MAYPLNPYSSFDQQQRLGAYGGGATYGAGGGGAYGSRYGGGAYSMGMRPPAAAVTGPTGSSSGSNAGAFEAGARQMEDQQQRQQSTNLGQNALNQERAGQSAADQARSVADYRTVRDSGIGNDNLNTSAAQRTQAKDLGIDPSSDASTIASAASGAVQPGADGRMAGGDTGNGSLVPNSADVAAAAAAAQARKTGAMTTATNNAYIQGAAPGQGVTGANPFTAGIAPRATPNMATSPAPGIAAQPATQPPLQQRVNPSMQTQPAPQPQLRPTLNPSMRLRPPVPQMTMSSFPSLGAAPAFSTRRPKTALTGS